MPSFHCQRLVVCYSVIGAAFGLMFPIIALAADYLILRPGLGAVPERIRTNPIHGIVALAPFVLGAVFHVIGRIQFALREKKEDLEVALKRARSSDAAKSEFLAAMSHELRTPLNGVLGMSDILSATTLDAEQKAFVEVIQSSGQTLLGVINDILDYSKIDSGFLMTRTAPFELRSMVEKPARLLAVLAAQKKLELLVRVDPALPEIVLGDETRLHQIVINLVGNAIKFTETGQVEVDVAPDLFDETLVRVEVRDTGCGIPADQIDTIFDRFSQVDSSFTRKQHGTGLGLAITKGLVELMEGFVDVCSEPGQGSVFAFVLHLPPASVAADATPVLHSPALKGSRAIVAMSNPVGRRNIMELLETWGADARPFPTGADALRHLADAAEAGTAIDLLLLDRHLPDMDALAVLNAVHADAALEGTAAIVLNSLGDPPVELAPEYAGVVRLSKPALAGDLAHAVREVLQDDPAKPVPRQSLVLVARNSEPATHRVDAAAGDDRAPVLIVDDNRTNVMIARKMIEAMGLRTVTAENGKEAVEAFHRDRPSIILMDVSMPVMDGYQATGAIRYYERDAALAPAMIIGLTAHATAEDRQKCFDHGMDNHLTKPVSASALRAIVDSAIPSSHQTGVA